MATFNLSNVVTITLDRCQVLNIGIDNSDGWGQTAHELIHALCAISDRLDIKQDLTDLLLQADPSVELRKINKL